MKKAADKTSNIKMGVNLAGIRLKTPLTVASGTFGYGREYEDFIDIAKIGAVIVKGTTLSRCYGNPAPRIAETPAGMLNAIGLENPGIDVFLGEHLPYLRDKGVTVIANIAGYTVEEYAVLAAKIEEHQGVAGIELNISCPNVKRGGIQFGTDPKLVFDIVASVKKATSIPVIPKLSPNVTDVVEIAQAAEDAGADALSLINTLLGMAIDINQRRPVLGNVWGGLSGPAIKPVALRMVYQVYKEVDIPILGGGGIMNYKDVLEFVMAGAKAVSIGTANFVDPAIVDKIQTDLFEYLYENGIKDINELVGVAHLANAN